MFRKQNSSNANISVLPSTTIPTTKTCSTLPKKPEKHSKILFQRHFKFNHKNFPLFSIIEIFLKTLNPHLWYVPLFPKKTEFKNFVAIVSSNYVVGNLCTKISALFQDLKTSFWAPFRPKTPEQEFSRKILRVNFKPICCHNLIQKNKKVPCTDISRLKKPDLEPI